MQCYMTYQPRCEFPGLSTLYSLKPITRVNQTCFNWGERRSIYYLFKFLHIELVHSIPSNSGGRKSASGRRLEIIAALPLIRWRDIFWISWPIISLSSEPVCLASAEPRRFSWLTARWCMPPSVSRAMGRKTSPCCRQALAVSCIFRS